MPTRFIPSVLLGASLAVAASAKEDCTFTPDADGQFTQQVMVRNTELTLLVDPSIGDVVALNPAAAQTVGLRNRSLAPVRAEVDGTMIRLASEKAPMRRVINGETGRKLKPRLIWSDSRDVTATEHDGVASPKALGCRNAVFVYRAADGADQIHAFPLKKGRRGWIGTADMDGLDRSLDLAFRPHLDRTQTDLVTTRQLSRAGVLSFPDNRVEESTRAFGVPIAVRNAVTQANLLPPLLMPAFTAQVAGEYARSGDDTDSGPGLDSVDANGTVTDPDIPARLWLGADISRRCSRVAYDIDAKEVRFHCN